MYCTPLYAAKRQLGQPVRGWEARHTRLGSSARHALMLRAGLLSSSIKQTRTAIR